MPLRHYNCIVSNQLTIAIYLMIAYTMELPKQKDNGKNKRKKEAFCPAQTIVRGIHRDHRDQHRMSCWAHYAQCIKATATCRQIQLSISMLPEQSHAYIIV
jgi:hypothetical protein